MKKISLYLLMILATGMLTSCGDDEPEITRVVAMMNLKSRVFKTAMARCFSRQEHSWMPTSVSLRLN